MRARFDADDFGVCIPVHEKRPGCERGFDPGHVAEAELPADQTRDATYVRRERCQLIELAVARENVAVRVEVDRMLEVDGAIYDARLGCRVILVIHELRRWSRGNRGFLLPAAVTL